MIWCLLYVIDSKIERFYMDMDKILGIFLRPAFVYVFHKVKNVDSFPI